MLHLELTELVKLAKADAAALWVWTPELEALQIRAHKGLSAAYVDYGNTTAVTAKSKLYAPIYRSLNHGYPVQFVEPQALHFPKYFEEWPEMSRFTQLATFPVLMQNVVIGVFSFYFLRVRTEHPWQDSLDLGLFVNRIADQLMATGLPERTPAYDQFMTGVSPDTWKLELVIEASDLCHKK